MSPDSLHIIPVRHNSVLHWISDAEQSTMVFGFWSHKQVAFEGASHDANMFRTSHAEVKEQKLIYEQLFREKRKSKYSCDVIKIFRQSLVAKHLLVRENAFGYLIASKARLDDSRALFKWKYANY
jgi:hypothetical protein